MLARLDSCIGMLGARALVSTWGTMPSLSIITPQQALGLGVDFNCALDSLHANSAGHCLVGARAVFCYFYTKSQYGLHSRQPQSTSTPVLRIFCTDICADISKQESLPFDLSCAVCDDALDIPFECSHHYHCCSTAPQMYW